MKVFELKMKVTRPDLVEAWDVTSNDPLFLMNLKMVRNAVGVPRHWS
jgi:splicing factor 3B subunit 2